MPSEFSFPKNLKDMSDEEKEKLRFNYLQHGRTIDYGKYCELSPSKVMDVDSPEFKAKKILKEISQKKIQYSEGADQSSIFKFDPQKGYIVPGEDKMIVTHMDIPEEDKKRILKNLPKPISPQEADSIRMAALAPVDREIEERFSDI